MTAAVPGPVLAMVGADEAVGAVMRQVLSTRDVWAQVRTMGAPSAPEFEDVDVVVFAGSRAECVRWAPVAVECGAVVVDGTGALAGETDVPLVVPGINSAHVRDRPRGVVATPSCTTLTAIDPLATLHAGWGLTELVVASYHSVSDVGPAGEQRLRDELAVVTAEPGLGRLPGDVRRTVDNALGEPGPFPAPLALNVVPWVGAADGDGWTSAEQELRTQTRTVLGVPGLKVSATCVRVPVVSGHSMAVHAVFERPIPVAEARQALVEAPSVVVLDDPAFGEFPTPSDVAGSDPTFVGRLRQSLDDPRTLELFVCGDNLRRGAALATLQIAELVVADLTAV